MERSHARYFKSAMISSRHLRKYELRIESPEFVDIKMDVSQICSPAFDIDAVQGPLAISLRVLISRPQGFGRNIESGNFRLTSKLSNFCHMTNTQNTNCYRSSALGLFDAF
ncbi:hypothetical protein CEXT_722531 [Caerostris extrusa]|uniref:Uncharacterized protein n=1 Tax=Caerostris extrusa TaxID=172846 RepID=A0AAV4XFQ2_CAEEX|nr:hypothetical protein CEXT_722531 [Caerostris extrusa]